MKNFKLKLNFLSNLFRKIRIFKKINSTLENVKDYLKFQNLKKKILGIYNKFYFEKFRINYLIFLVSLLVFITLFIYLSREYYIINQTKTTLRNY